MLSVLALPALGTGCDGDDDDEIDEDVVGAPNVLIWGPLPGASVALDEELDLPMLISYDNFTVRPPGECGGQVSCGHVRVFIDGDTCNAAGQPYNTLAGSFSGDNIVTADFSSCPEASRLGAHLLSVGLYDDAGQPVIGDAGAPASATISVIVVR
jgi:hypothetical protein